MLSNSIDYQYNAFVKEVLNNGRWRETRNAKTFSSFGHTLKFHIDDRFPLLTSRKIFYRGVFGEFKSFMQDVNTVAGFEDNSCPFWSGFGEDDGSLILDYPPREQLDYIINLLKTDPMSRRMVISLWNPEHVGKLSLECCHYGYQFYVRGDELDMIWTQRSLDIAVGLPSDIILASLYVIMLAKETGLKPGKVTMNFGDAHIYEDHYADLIAQVNLPIVVGSPKYAVKEVGIREFDLDTIEIQEYNPGPSIKYKLEH